MSRKLIQFALLLLSLPLMGHAQSCTTSTCNAASANESDVLAALPSNSNTNATVVVNIPSGTASWSSQLTYDIPSAVTNLTIQGNTTINCTGTAGTSSYSCSAIDTTIIKDAATNNDHLWQITTGSSSTYFRMTGLTLEGGNIGSTSYPKNNGIVNFAGGSQNFRLDHNHFNDTTYTPSVYGAMAQFNGTIEGVLDHNVLDLGGQGSVANGFQSFTTIGDNVGNGDGTWASATGWGTTAFLFMESNQVNGGYGNDCFWASRMTLRYNTFSNYTVAAQGHPTKTAAGPGRGCRALEIYKNYVNGSNATPQDAAFGAPVGSALIWGNTFAGGAYRFWAAGTFRNETGQAETATPNGWGYCGTIEDGTGSNWDGNNPSASLGYPCLDGIGRGKTQQSLNGYNGFYTSPGGVGNQRLNSSTNTIAWPQQEFEPVYMFDNTILSSATTFGQYADLRDNGSVLDRDVVYDCGTFPNSVTNPDCPSGFTGSVGAGFGLLSARPSTCTPGAGGTYFASPTGSYGVAYWATDANSGSGELYVCTSTNNWTPVYQPYTYPHPLVGGATYTWTVTATNGSVTGTNSASGTYSSGTTIGPTTAVPNAGYVFSSWSGVSGSAACSGATNPCPSFSITANSAVTANFVSGGVTVATGDTRTITEPTFPATCSTVQATKYIVSTNAVNIDPFNSTCGSTGGTNGTLGCTGGTSYEPSSTSGSYTSSETLDNSAITAALSSCPSGQAVELIAGSSGQLGLVLSPLSIPSGKSLILDSGIHVFASRNLSDYGGTNCGLVTSGTSGCNPWITAPSSSNSGIYGYGILDGRGWDAYIGQTTSGFYANRIQAYCNNHGGAQDGSPACTPNGAGNNSYGPNSLNLVSANNFTLYKTTIKDSGNFIFNWSGGNGLTAWGAKLIAPFEVSNTDGFDPLNSQNGTFTHGIISNGDNHVAVKSTSSASQNITLSFNQTGAGIALAIGTDINSSGINNILFTNNVQRGNLYNVQSAGLQIGSSSANGGLVNQVTFLNDCMVNENNSVRLYTNYGGNSGSSPPQYTNILIRNLHVLPSTAPYTTGNSGFFTFQGLSGLPMGVQLDNFVIDGVNQGVASQSGVTKDQYANIYLGPGAVDSSLLTQFSAGTSVVTSGSAGSSTPYTCTTSTWQPLVGDLNLKTTTSNNNQSYTNTGSLPYTLQVVLQPATEISTKESPALTAAVTFLDNGSSIGTAPLLGDGSFASFTVSSPPSGTHVYTARYPGDSNYSAFTFGSITVTNSGTRPPAPISIITIGP